MKHARDVLNEIKWRDEMTLNNTVVLYRDRMRQSLVELDGAQIQSWDKSFIYTISDSAIPFHRVQVILHNNVEMFRRPSMLKKC